MSPKHPAELVVIAPENLEVANAYLRLQSIDAVAEELGFETDYVLQVLESRPVKSYIDHVYFNMGFNNRFTIRSALDAIIAKKFEELEESGMGSTKDIADLLELSHRMTMQELDRQIALKKLEQSSVKTQTNIQINDAGGGSNYAALLAKLMQVPNAGSK